jgi:hypothetical protein
MDAQVLQAALAPLQQVLEERWELTLVADNTYQFEYLTEPGIPMACLAWINPQSEGLFFRVVMQLPVEQHLRPLMAELITRINYPLANGAFVLDYETGDLRFKSALFFGGTPLTQPLIRHLIDSSLMFVDQHILSVVKVMMGSSIIEALDPHDEEAEATSGDGRKSFEEFIVSYLYSLFLAAGVPDVSRAEIEAFQQHLEATMGSQYLFGGYNGVPRQQLNEQDMRSAYERGTLRFSASARGMAVIQTYKEELLRQRQQRA